MGDLLHSRELSVQLQAPAYKTLVIHPHEGQKIDLLESSRKFRLYPEMGEFIHATDEYISITLEQQNNCDQKVIRMKHRLKKELGNPERVKIFRKNRNLFLKPL